MQSRKILTRLKTCFKKEKLTANSEQAIAFFKQLNQ